MKNNIKNNNSNTLLYFWYWFQIELCTYWWTVAWSYMWHKRAKFLICIKKSRTAKLQTALSRLISANFIIFTQITRAWYFIKSLFWLTANISLMIPSFRLSMQLLTFSFFFSTVSISSIFSFCLIFFSFCAFSLAMLSISVLYFW